MDVTPEQLRAPRITEAFRGYHRTQVDLLLDRAASTIEKLTEQLHGGRTLAPAELSGIDAGTIERTLILAQSAADAVVSEAQELAGKTLAEADSKAKSLVDVAEASAQRIHDDAERRLRNEMDLLIARRDRLQAESDALEIYASEYRARVWATVDADLAKIGVTIEPPSVRPESHDPDRETSGVLSRA